jgi:hypothetical protein
MAYGRYFAPWTPRQISKPLARNGLKVLQLTQKFRPALLSPRRPVPAHVRKPDYADHPAGVSIPSNVRSGSHTTFALRCVRTGRQETGFVTLVVWEVLTWAARRFRPE